MKPKKNHCPAVAPPQSAPKAPPKVRLVTQNLKSEIEAIRERVLGLVGENPHKAATILSEWIKRK
jgi:flagellar biosynthesis/type III secretory pathway M-ring protein FliF/YscJ